MVIALIILGVLAAMVALAALLLPAATEVRERARIDQEAQDASYRIHQQATEAFGRMLEAARHNRFEDRS